MAVRDSAPTPSQEATVQSAAAQQAGAEVLRLAFIRSYPVQRPGVLAVDLDDPWFRYFSARFVKDHAGKANVMQGQASLPGRYAIFGEPVTFAVEYLHFLMFGALVVMLDVSGPGRSDIRWLTERRTIHGTGASPLVDDKGSRVNFFELWDLARNMYAGGPPTEQKTRRNLPMRLGPVGLFRFGGGTVDLRERERVPGITPHDTAYVSPTLLAVQLGTATARGEADLNDLFRRYLVVAAHADALRMVEDHIRADVQAIARKELAKHMTANQASLILAESKDVQRRWVLLQAAVTGADWFAETGIAPFSYRSRQGLGLEEDRLGHLSTSLDSLERYVTGVFSSASYQAQRSLNHVGFVFGLLGVTFAATEIVSFTHGGLAQRVTIAVAWALSVAFVWVAYRISIERSRARRKRAQQPNVHGARDD